MTAGADHHLKLKLKAGVTPEQITLHQEWDTKGLNPGFDEAFKHLQTEVLNLRERVIADALIKLGWCPPKDHPQHHEAMDRLRYQKMFEGPRNARTFYHDEYAAVDPAAYGALRALMADTMAHTNNPPITLRMGTTEDGINPNVRGVQVELDTRTDGDV